jgi:hypothetical protein
MSIKIRDIAEIPKGITKQNLQTILAEGEAIMLSSDQYLFSYKDEKPNFLYVIFQNTDNPKFFLITMDNIFKIINKQDYRLSEITPNKSILKIAIEINPECEWLYSFYMC